MLPSSSAHQVQLRTMAMLMLANGPAATMLPVTLVLLRRAREISTAALWEVMTTMSFGLTGVQGM